MSILLRIATWILKLSVFLLCLLILLVGVALCISAPGYLTPEFFAGVLFILTGSAFGSLAVILFAKE